MAQLGNPFQAALFNTSSAFKSFKVRNPLHSTYWLSRLNRYENLLLVAFLILEIQKKKTRLQNLPIFPPSQSPSRCDMDRFKLPSVCFVAKCVTVQCGAKPVSVKGLYQEVSSLAIANLTVYPHTQHDSNKWRLKGQRCLSEKQHECMNWIGFFQDPSGGSLAFLGVRSQCHCFQLQKMKW